MARQYVTYEQVKRGLCHEPHSINCYPGEYLRHLREETGLSWAKLAHDLSVDSGCKVSKANARRWAR